MMQPLADFQDKSKKQIQVVFQGKQQTKSGGFMSILRLLREPFKKQAHSHERENARRCRQIARGIIKVTAMLLIVFCVDRPGVHDDCYSSLQKAADACDNKQAELGYCRSMYERAR